MKRKIINYVFSTTVLGGVLLLASCTKSDPGPMSAATAVSPVASTRSGTNGIASAIPAYYDSKLYTIIFVEFPPRAEATLIANNPSINFIYQSDPGLPGGKPFISVIDAIPGDGMNPVWREVQIAFNPGFTPRQFFRDDDVLAAAQGPNAEITLNFTNEVYYCPVIGQKP